MNKHKTNQFALMLILITGVYVVYNNDLLGYISVENIQNLQEFISSFGIIAPLVFIITYVLATIFFLPGLPLTLLSGIVFGPIMGTVYVSISSVLGASLSFIIAKTLGRRYLENKFSDSSLFKKIESGIKEHGWQMILVTRLLPIFPYNLQNYLYGLTNVRLKTFSFVSWIGMLPGTVAFVFLAGSITSGSGDIGKTLLFLSVGSMFFILVLIVQKVISQKFID